MRSYNLEMGPGGSAGARLSGPLLRRGDRTYAAFLRLGYSTPGPFCAVQMPADAASVILFSSGSAWRILLTTSTDAA